MSYSDEFFDKLTMFNFVEMLSTLIDDRVGSNFAEKMRLRGEFIQRLVFIQIVGEVIMD